MESTLFNAALEYVHHLQEVGIIDNPADEIEKENIANYKAHRIVEVLTSLGE